MYVHAIVTRAQAMEPAMVGPPPPPPPPPFVDSPRGCCSRFIAAVVVATIVILLLLLFPLVRTMIIIIRSIIIRIRHCHVQLNEALLMATPTIPAMGSANDNTNNDVRAIGTLAEKVYARMVVPRRK